MTITEREIESGEKNIVNVMAIEALLPAESFADTVVAQCFSKKPTQSQLWAFLMVARAHDLNPLLKQIQAFVDKRGNVVPYVGIDGWGAIMSRHPEFGGIETEFIYRDDKLWSCRASIWRKGCEHPFVCEEILSENYVGPRGNPPKDGPWQTHTHRMLRHRAIIQGGRVMYGITGIYDEDEGARIAGARTIDVEPENEAVAAFNAGLKEEQEAGETESPPVGVAAPLPASPPPLPCDGTPGAVDFKPCAEQRDDHDGCPGCDGSGQVPDVPF